MRSRVFRVLLSGATVGVLLAVPSGAAALPYDGTNPAATACGDGTHGASTVLMSQTIKTDAGTAIGKVELRQSVYCATVWSRVWNYTSSSRSVREILITYDTPNGGGATSHTETDTLGAKGSSTESGWSKQYRDRASFRARGEIYYGGVWVTAQTSRSNAWNQDDGNFPSSPYSCNNTSGYYCHRWPTTSTGGPITLQYGFDDNMANLPGTPESSINYNLDEYQALSGGAPNYELVDYSDPRLDILFQSYYDTGDPALARAGSLASNTSPRYFYYGHVDFNDARNLTAYNALVCHEFGHVLGLHHITSGGIVGSKASCMDAEFTNGPYIDDQSALTEIYSTPLP